MEGRILSITLKEIKELRRFTEKYPQAKSRDLMHLSVMLANGISKIITADRDFERFEEVEAIRPADLF
jgi:predicted nucleic acid-binding protein